MATERLWIGFCPACCDGRGGYRLHAVVTAPDARSAEQQMAQTMAAHQALAHKAKRYDAYEVRELAVIETTATEDALDLDLLRKLATGKGGRRTAALKRAGLLEWKVTTKGMRTLGLGKKRP